MRQTFPKTCLAILIGLALTATGLWATGADEGSTAAAADKRYVTDPTTGNVHTEHEWGGTITHARAGAMFTTQNVDTAQNNRASGLIGSLVNEKLGTMDWALDRDAYPFNGGFSTPVSALRGALAESWETPDATTYVFNIRQGVHWHDKAPMNGRELTAQDVAYNFHRQLGLGSGFTEPQALQIGSFGNLPWESIEATDDHTVVIKMNKPSLTALSQIMDNQSAIIYPPEVIEEHGDAADWRNLVGTGPFELTDWVSGSSFTYTKNPNYWGFDPKWPENRLPYVDEVIGLIIVEFETRLAGLRSGAIDYIGHPGSTQLFSINDHLSLQRTNPELQQFAWSQRSEGTAVHMNVQKPPFDDVRVRHAMQMALDFETMNSSFFKGFAEILPRGRIGRTFSSYIYPYEEWPAELKGYYTYDPAAAEKLLDEAGYPRGADGVRFKTTFTHFPRWDVGWPEFMAAYWAEIGIDVSIETPSSAEFMARRGALDFDMVNDTAGIKANPSDQWWQHTSGDTSGWQMSTTDARHDALYEDLLEATTVEEVERLSREMDQNYIEQHWTLWGPDSPVYNVAQPWVMGYTGEGIMGGGTNNTLFQYLWIDSRLKEAMGH